MDRLFRNQLNSYDAFRSLIPADNPLLRLENLPQHEMHRGFDPLHHTYNALKLLSTDGIVTRAGLSLPCSQRPLSELVRISMLYHDVGKVDGPMASDHALRSSVIARDILSDPALSGVGRMDQGEIDFVCLLIRTHEVLGTLAKGYSSRELTENDIMQRISEEFGSDLPEGFSINDMFNLHARISQADIESIPGLRANARSVVNILANIISDRLAGSVQSDNHVPAAQESPQLSNEMRRLNRFIPSLLTKIRQAILKVELKFTEDSLIFSNGIEENEYYDGRFIARSFLRAGIRELTLKEFPNKTELDQLRILLEEAGSGMISPAIRGNLASVGAIEQITEISLAETEQEFIPGFYKHYTSQSNFEKIIRRGLIGARPHSKNGTVREGVYLTGLSLAPQEAWETIFIRNPEYADRTTHVVAFDILDPKLAARIQQTGIEFFLEEGISLADPRISVRYSGENHIGEAA
ncbi:MAG: hypothetical protein KJ732_06575 [Candidatus Margulisbacteria bacterium]|nr:hypothetical protein [Candidatus Margulisiibacteriota bacterium]